MIIDTKKGKLPVRYGMNALAHFGDLTGKSMNVVMKSMGELGDMQLSELLAFIYAGFVDGARWAKEECKIDDIAEVGDMIDDDSELVNKMFDAFNGDSEEVDGDSKKKITFDELQSIAFGEVGISHADFWNMTLQEILDAHKGYLEKTYNDWRRTRWLATVFANAFGTKDVKPSDLMSLPGDDTAPDFTNEIKKIEEHGKQIKGDG